MLKFGSLIVIKFFVSLSLLQALNKLTLVILRVLKFESVIMDYVISYHHSK